MVKRLLIALVLLAATAQGQVVRKILRPDLGSVTNNTGCVMDVTFGDGLVYDSTTKSSGSLSGAVIQAKYFLITSKTNNAYTSALAGFGSTNQASMVLLGGFTSYGYIYSGLAESRTGGGLVGLGGANGTPAGMTFYWNGDLAEYGASSGPHTPFQVTGVGLVAGATKPSLYDCYYATKSILNQSRSGFSNRSWDGYIFTLGSDSSTPDQRYFTGRIVRFLVFNRYLTQSEITAFNARRPTQ